MNTIDRNIVITFEDDLANQFIRLSQAVGGKVTSKINLNHKNEIPHLTLYMSTYPTKNIELIINKLAEIAKSTKPFKLKLKSKSCHPTGTIFINAVLSDELYQLHKELVEAINPLREGVYNKKDLSFSGMTEKTRRSLKEYGMWEVKNSYIPHVSVGRITDLKDCETALSALPEKINYETLVESIALVETGHDGTCKKTLMKFKFKI